MRGALALLLLCACRTPPEVWAARPALVVRPQGTWVRVPSSVDLPPHPVVRWEGRSTTQLVLFAARGPSLDAPPPETVDGVTHLPVTLPKAWRAREPLRNVWWRYPNRRRVRMPVVLEPAPASGAGPAAPEPE